MVAQLVQHLVYREIWYMYIVTGCYQALSAIHDVQYIVYIHDCTCTCTCRCNEVHFFLPSPPSSRAQLARVILRTVVRPVTVTPTWCVRLWPALQCWMTGQTLTGPPSPLETEWLCRDSTPLPCVCLEANYFILRCIALP